MITSILQRRACQTANRPFFTVVSPEKKEGVGGCSLEIESLYQYLLLDSHHPLDKLCVTHTLHHQAERNTDANTSNMTTMWKQLSFHLYNFCVTWWCERGIEVCPGHSGMRHPCDIYLYQWGFFLLAFVGGYSLYAQSPDEFWCVSKVLV